MIDFINRLIYRSRLKKYVKSNLKRGYSEEEIISRIKEGDVPEELIHSVVNDVKHKNTEFFFFISITVLLLFGGAVYFGYNWIHREKVENRFMADVNQCKSLSGEQRTQCLEEAQWQINEEYAQYLDLAKDRCRAFPSIEYTENCFNSLGISLGLYYQTNLSMAVNRCEDFPRRYVSFCFIGLTRSINQNFDKGNEIDACNELPVQYRLTCIENANLEIINDES